MRWILIMAEWIPIQVDLSRRSEVVRIAQFCEISRHEAVGMLVDFWGWCSSESVDGHVDGHVDAVITLLHLHPQFAGAMVFVNWLKIKATSFYVPNWDRWLSESGKSRIQKNLRQKKWRKNVDGHVDGHVDHQAPLHNNTVHNNNSNYKRKETVAEKIDRLSSKKLVEKPQSPAQ